MYVLSQKSLDQLITCHPTLQGLLREMIKHRDFTVVEGYRGEALQNKYYDEGKSKVRFPNGKHNKYPSKAVDIYPYPIDQSMLNPKEGEHKRAKEMWIEWGSWVVGFAAGYGVKLRWGFDWDMDHDLGDQTFYDGPHFELVED